MTAHITTFIVNGLDYFTANLSNGGTRVGCVGSYCFDFPYGHELSDKISSTTNEAEAEEVFDVCAGIYI